QAAKEPIAGSQGFWDRFYCQFDNICPQKCHFGRNFPQNDSQKILIFNAWKSFSGRKTLWVLFWPCMLETLNRMKDLWNI
ncbi:MAG TPA: hypothetical protein PLK08_08605, partial [Phycisphaerae bacterium]|nr:hypothetical protein [Phycisphaerae bacterium]